MSARLTVRIFRLVILLAFSSTHLMVELFLNLSIFIGIDKKIYSIINLVVGTEISYHVSVLTNFYFYFFRAPNDLLVMI